MNIFNLFRTSSPIVEAEEQPVINTVEADASDSSDMSSDSCKNKKDDDMITITYGTGMPIDIIYNYLKRSYESNGYNDAFVSIEHAYMEKNLMRLRGLLEIKFNQVRLRYEGNIRIIDQRIESCRNNGLFATMNNLSSEKAMYEHHLEKLDEMETDYKEEKPYMMTFLTSYENGFLRGIAAIAVGATKPEMSNVNDL